MDVGSLDGVFVEAKRLEHVEIKIIKLSVGETKLVPAEIIAKRESVESEFHVEGAFHCGFELGQLGIAKALVLEGGDRNCLTVFQAAIANRIFDDVVNLLLTVAHIGQCFGHHAIDDLEIATAGQFLEFHNGEIWLDPSGVTIHYQTDCSGRGDHSGLRIAIAMCLAQRHGLVPRGARRFDEIRIRAGVGIKRHRHNAQPFVAIGVAMRCQPVILHHPQHMLLVLFILRESTHLTGDLG